MTALAILVIAFGLVLGLLTQRQAFRKLGRLLIVAALAPVLIGMGKNYFWHLPLAQKVLFALIAVPVGIVVVMRIVLGKDLFNHVAGNFVYDGLRAILSFPFRIISAIVRKYR